jgi:transcriptional regulator with XRE-family HTH domain
MPISFYRGLARLSQHQLAVRCGMTLRYLRDLETGKQRRFTVRVARIAAELDVPLAYLMI